MHCLAIFSAWWPAGAAAAAAGARAAFNGRNPAGRPMIDMIVNGVRQNSVTAYTLLAGRTGFRFEGGSFELRGVSVVALD